MAEKQSKHELGIFRTSRPTKKVGKNEKSNGTQSKKKNSNDQAPQKSDTTAGDKPTTTAMNLLADAAAFIKRVSKSPERHTQKLLMKTKKAKECFAETILERKQVSRECANRTVAVENVRKPVIRERVELTVKATDRRPSPSSALDQDCEPALIHPCDSITSLSTASSFTHIQLVESKLNDIARQADELARSIKLADYLSQADDALISSSSDESKDPLQPAESSEVVTSSGANVSTDEPHYSEICCEPPQRDNDLQRSYTSGNVLQSLSEATRNLMSMSMSQRDELSESSNADVSQLDKHSFAERITKGLHDITHGSSDRLLKWKSKLNTTRTKDHSEQAPTSRKAMPSAASDVLASLASDSRSPRPLHTSKSATNAMSIINAAAGLSNKPSMEHRTLKSKENSASEHDLSFHFTNLNDLQNIMNSFEGYAANGLPPPARIMPYSGVKPSSDDIIKPVAFRPTGKSDSKPRVPEKKVIRGDLTKSAQNIHQYLQQQQMQQQRQQTVFQPSTSFCSLKWQENEYDTVPDYMEKEKIDFDFYNGNSKTSTCSSGINSGPLHSPPTSLAKTTHSSQSSSGRTSSGIHITPSPSDSGIVDFETIIRDKENELKEVRNTMEQNEEIIVKVYLEKERAWKAEVEHLRARLSASQKGENALRSQLQSSQKQNDVLNRTIEGLREEKTGLLRKCFQLERELGQMRVELNKARICDECQRQKPVPAPRQIKEKDATIRDEVNSLREELATLKSAMAGQLNLFSDNKKTTDISKSSEQPRDRLI